MAAPTPHIPRPEHPRPDLHRGLRPGHDWVNLNGIWKFQFDPGDIGTGSDWAERAPEGFSRRIVVPFPWESHLAWGTEHLAGSEDYYSREVYLDPASVTPENYREAPRHTIGWYHRQFAVPRSWRDRRVFLNIGAVDWHCRLWVNGIAVGEAVSGYVPLSFDITEALNWEAESVVIRVEDPFEHGRQPIGKQVSNWYQRTSGIWQTVWLEPRGPVHLREVLAYPSLAQGQVRFAVALDGQVGGDLSVRIEVRSATGMLAGHGSASVDAETVQLTIPIDRPRAWTPDQPHMYRATVTVHCGEELLDRVYCSFGLRDVGVCSLHGDGPPYICLNGKPIYLRGALDQSFHPAGVYSYPSDEALRQDLLLAKRAGFNFLRLHIKAEDPRWYYWADRLGVLLMCDMPSFGYDAYSPEACANWQRCAEAIIRRDFNHPSIFSWCLFNETWGLGGRQYAEMPERQQWVRECYEWAKGLDPTRLIEDNSPCLYDHVVTDINSWHFYINDYQQAREHIEKVVANTYPGSTFNFVGGNVQGNQPLLNSEYGGIGARMGDLDVSWCFRFLTNELRRHEKICGYVYTELQDIEWERNGVYDYDRSPKQFGYDPALLQGEYFVGLDGPPARTVTPASQVEIPVFLRPGGARWESFDLRWNLEFTDALGERAMLVRDAPLAGVEGAEAVLQVAMPDQPGLARLEVLLHDGSRRVQAMNFCYLESVGEMERVLRSERRVLLRADLAAACLDFADEPERGEVGGCVELLSGMGAGHIELQFPVPEDIAPEQVRAARLRAELSSRRPGAPQTGVDQWPSAVTVSVGDWECAGLWLPDQPADSRGALSHMHGFQGRYGQLVDVDLPLEALQRCWAEGGIQVRLSATVPAIRGGGLAVYGTRAGRYPCGVWLLLALDRRD